MTQIEHEIPPMTHELSRHWDQPDRSEILLDEKNALMNRATMERLCDYSCTNPSGVYDGKMWRRRVNYHDESKGYYLCWFYPSSDPEKCSQGLRKIILAD